jgi:hypothetical protein
MVGEVKKNFHGKFFASHVNREAEPKKEAL